MPGAKLSPLGELAARINDHLKRFEADPVINAYREGTTLSPYYKAWARQSGRYIGVSYITYQGVTNLTKDEATRYLAKLDAGFVGRHWDALRESKA